MKLVRHGAAGREKPGVLDASGTVRDLSAHLADIDGAALGRLDEIRRIDPASLPAVAAGTRLGPCVGNVGKIVAVGLNYADHAAETGAQVPAEPILFMKATSAISGPFDDVILPPDSAKLDWEVELGVAIGRTARRVSEADAMAHVAGYFTANDVSEREWQMERGGTWDKGKSGDTFAPIGPWLVTRDEVADPQNLKLWLEVDGQRRQNGSTRTMVFGVATLVSYISRFMTLHPGDLIMTGTPPGVGLGMKPPTFLAAGQAMRVGVEGLGEQVTRVVAG
jgi:2-keto-4-pentenoate hydratase/2-oxohepta-3-ene-1,7-dioic acid hydratase in catechol pathway